MPFFNTNNPCPVCGENLKKNPPSRIKYPWYKYVKAHGFSCNSCRARLKKRFGQSAELPVLLAIGIPTFRLSHWKFIIVLMALWMAGHAVALLFVSEYVELK